MPPSPALCRDAITYSAVISALAKGRQWGASIELFHHMTASEEWLACQLWC
jgi:pentatricopeptide repeat protein